METNTAVRAFAALAQETRLDIVKALIKAGPAGISAGALAETLGAPPSTLSFHLKELQNAALIHSRKDGRSVIYRADYGGVRGVVDYLMADCCQGDPRLCGPYVIKGNAA